MRPQLPRGATRRTRFFGRRKRPSRVLTTESFAGHDAGAAKELRVGDAMAAFELDVLHSQHGFAAARYEQPVFLGRQDGAGRATARDWLERLAPNSASFSAKGREAPGPGLLAADAVVDCSRGERPIDSAVFLLENWRESRLRIVLRHRLDLAARQFPKRFDDQRCSRFGQTRDEVR